MQICCTSSWRSRNEREGERVHVTHRVASLERTKYDVGVREEDRWVNWGWRGGTDGRSNLCMIRSQPFFGCCMFLDIKHTGPIRAIRVHDTRRNTPKIQRTIKFSLSFRRLQRMMYLPFSQIRRSDQHATSIAGYMLADLILCMDFV